MKVVYSLLFGAALGASLVLSDEWIAIYLAGFAGIVIYLATSHILPEAHARHSSRWTIAFTLIGVGIMWTLVSYLHSGEEHDHASESVVNEELVHTDEHNHG